MAEIATIARPYAEALFKASQSDLNGTEAWLDEVAAIAADEQLLQFSDSPKVSQSQVFDLIAGLTRNVLPLAAQNFLRMVIENGRLGALPQVASQFRALKNVQTGSADAVVRSAFPVDDFAMNDLKAVLERRFGRPLNLQVDIDPSLIGGICVVVGDEVLDTSVRARLEQMKVALSA